MEKLATFNEENAFAAAAAYDDGKIQYDNITFYGHTLVALNA